MRFHHSRHHPFGSLVWGASPALAVWVSTGALVVYVVVSGVHGSAWTAVLKDLMILMVVVTLGIYLPVHYYGGYGPMFRAIDSIRPGFIVLPTIGMSPAWLISTVLVTAVGFFMWPHSFASIYTARSERVFRRNAAVMPVYQLILLFVLFVGFVAMLQVPGLKGADTDLALLRISKATFSPTVVGVIGAAGLLTALVPGSMLLVAASTVLVQSVLRPAIPSIDDHAAARIAKALVPVIALVAIWLTLRPGDALVPLLLMGYTRRLSLSRSPRSPSLRFPFLLIEPDVTISVIRLSDGFHLEGVRRGESRTGIGSQNPQWSEHVSERKLPITRPSHFVPTAEKAADGVIEMQGHRTPRIHHRTVARVGRPAPHNAVEVAGNVAAPLRPLAQTRVVVRPPSVSIE